MSQRHGDYYGFVKTRFKTKQFYVDKMENSVPFWRPLDFEGGPKSTIFEKTNEKMEVQETALKTHDLFYRFLMLK